MGKSQGRECAFLPPLLHLLGLGVRAGNCGTLTSSPAAWENKGAPHAPSLQGGPLGWHPPVAQPAGAWLLLSPVPQPGGWGSLIFLSHTLLLQQALAAAESTIIRQRE